jgi:hypothetical protein
MTITMLLTGLAILVGAGVAFGAVVALLGRTIGPWEADRLSLDERVRSTP